MKIMICSHDNDWLAGRTNNIYREEHVGQTFYAEIKPERFSSDKQVRKLRIEAVSGDSVRAIII